MGFETINEYEYDTSLADKQNAEKRLKDIQNAKDQIRNWTATLNRIKNTSSKEHEVAIAQGKIDEYTEELKRLEQ